MSYILIFVTILNQFLLFFIIYLQEYLCYRLEWKSVLLIGKGILISRLYFFWNITLLIQNYFFSHALFELFYFFFLLVIFFGDYVKEWTEINMFFFQYTLRNSAFSETFILDNSLVSFIGVHDIVGGLFIKEIFERSLK